jgi:hypothetical protein
VGEGQQVVSGSGSRLYTSGAVAGNPRDDVEWGAHVMGVGLGKAARLSAVTHLALPVGTQASTVRMTLDQAASAGRAKLIVAFSPA